MEFILKSLPDDPSEYEDWFEKEVNERERAFDLINDKLLQLVMGSFNQFGKSSLSLETPLKKH